MPTPPNARSRASSKSRSTKTRNPKTPPIEILQADCFAELPWLVHGFSTRRGGVSTCYGGKSLNLGRTEHDTEANVDRNRQLLLMALSVGGGKGAAWPLMQVKQVHSAVVHRIASASDKVSAGDGMITAVPEILLAIKTADCVPVLVVDIEKRAVGAFHAGWRGTVARIVEKGVGEMRRQFGSRPQDLRAAIGPCIRSCCYRVGDEVRSEFQSQFAYADGVFEEVFDSQALHIRYPLLFLNQRAPGHGDLGPEIHLDLVKANRRQLLDAGVGDDHICVVEGCTACNTGKFFSHRSEFGKTGRMMAVVGIKG